MLMRTHAVITRTAIAAAAVVNGIRVRRRRFGQHRMHQC